VSVTDLYAAHRLTLVRLAVLLVDDRETAQDIVQDAFAGLHQRQHALADPDRALGYLRTSVVNGARSTLRRRRTARAYVPAHEPPEPSPEAALVIAEEHREMLEAVRELPRRQREVVVLRYWLNLDEASIARELGVSRGTVKSSASRALKALEGKLGASHG
jgi:RNA polymerase sigma-70 factor (sigma-E family)